MGSPLTPETQQRIRALCGEIAVAHDIDPELREELRGHVEDKICAYLSGEEAVNEADALILAREHFGDRAQLKSMLSDVHHGESAESLWRRMAAGVIVMLGLYQILVVLAYASAWAAVSLGMTSVVTQGFTHAIRMILCATIFPVLLWRILARWKGALRREETPWFVRWRPKTLGACVLGVLAISSLLTFSVTLADGVVQARMVVPGGTQDWSKSYVLALMALFLFNFAVIEPALWMWWCDERPRRRRAVSNAILVWSLATFYTLSFGGLFGFVTAGTSVREGVPVLLELSSGTLVLAPVFSRMSFLELGRHFGTTFLSCVAGALLGWLAYAAARGARMRFAHVQDRPLTH